MIVDDDDLFGEYIEVLLAEEGLLTEHVLSGEACLERLESILPTLICLDMGLPGLNGLEVLERIRSTAPLVPVIMLTASDDIGVVVETMRAGAYDYHSKPIDEQRFCLTIQRAIEQRALRDRLRRLEREERGGYGRLVGRSPAMRHLFDQVDRIANSHVTVLIHGESGTGKELVAQSLHEQSRSGRPFVAINCAAIPENLIESELFGHEKGSFTGATTRRIGRFEQADGGTIFLDEVAELDPGLQAKLLRVLQERAFTRVGSAELIRSNFRLIAATHRDLLEQVRAREFREDLFFRLAVFELEIPPLRARGEDVLLLAEDFAARHAIEHDQERPAVLSSDLRDVLMNYNWPGNVRELQNALMRALVIARRGVLEAEHLPPRILRSVRAVAPPGPTLRPEDSSYESRPEALVADQALELAGLTLEEIERRAIVAAMQRHGDHLKAVIDELGISRTTLYRKLKRYNEDA